MEFQKHISLSLVLILSALTSYGQDRVAKSIQTRFELYANTALQEKIYLHLDRPTYLIGETIWFQAYNVDAARHKILDMSKVAYMELLDKENNAVAQTKFTLTGGKGNGAMNIPSTIVSGSYKVRCYTSWMKNFGPDTYFETNLTILNPFIKFDPDPDAEKALAYDVQFFPEGGYLVKDVESKVAFRAVGANGKGINFFGVLLNEQNDTLARFHPSKHGIGNFVFKPAQEGNYKVSISDENGKQFNYPFPEVKKEGYVMQVKNGSPDEVIVRVTRAGLEEPGSAYIFSHSNQLHLFSDKLNFKDNVAEVVLKKSQLGEGVSHITILNEKLKPICERLYFKRPSKGLSLNATVAKEEFMTREKVTLNLTAQEQSNLSVSVYMTDHIGEPEQDDITSFFYLTSDLKGTVENPSYYFKNVTAQTDNDLDNVMITHGWRRLKWENVLGATAPKYQYLPEYDGHIVLGNVLNTKTNKPAPGIGTYFAPLDFPAKLFGAVSDQFGNVLYELKHFVGAKEVTIQTDLSKDSTYKVEIASPFSKDYSQKAGLPFFFDKKNENELLTRSINMQTGNAFLPRMYKENKPVLTDSLAFFGLPDEKYFLDDYTRFPTVEEVMREYVRGVLVRRRNKEFHFRMIDRLLPNTYYRTDPLTLLDGIPIFNIDKVMEIDPLKIKKIELMSSRYLLGGMQFTGIVSMSTYKNDLAGFELDPKVLVMSYEGVQAERVFYSPKYDKASDLASRLPDFRNLLQWSPNIISDQAGKAQIQFFTSDQTGNYKVVVHGITENGVTGSKVIDFKVGKRSL